MPTLPRTSKRRRPKGPPPTPDVFFALTEALDLGTDAADATSKEEASPPPSRIARVCALSIVVAPVALTLLLLLRKEAWFTVPSKLTYDFEKRVNVWRPSTISPLYFGALGAVLLLAVAVLVCAVWDDRAATTRRRPKGARHAAPERRPPRARPRGDGRPPEGDGRPPGGDGLPRPSMAPY